MTRATLDSSARQTSTGLPVTVVAAALVALTLISVAFGLVVAGGSYEAALPGLPDPGPIVGWGTPIVRALTDLAAIANWQDADTAQEWMFSQGQNGFARLYHYKTAETALGSAAIYRWGEWGYQETLIQARIGREPSAQIWINHPGEIVQSGFGRPSFWGGSASIPRVQQYRDLAVVKFDGDAAQPGFTHAWFPTQSFDDWSVKGHRAAARSGKGALILSCSGALEQVASDGSAGHELRLAGRDGLWLVRLGRAENLGDFSAAHDLSAVVAADGTIRVMDRDYGEVVFHPDGTVDAEGRHLDPRDWTLAGERRVIALN